jgi:hypothetical protein
VNKQRSQKDDLGPDRKGSCQTLLYTPILTMGSEVNVSSEGEDPLQAALDEAEHSMSKLATSTSRDNLVMDGFSIDSDEDDGGELEGTGHGSEAIFVIWLILSVSLLAAFSHFTPGMKLYSPFEQLLILSVLAIFYVDNGMPDINDATDDSHRKPELLLQQAEACAHSQEGVLFASSRALEFSKCFA